MSSDAGGVLGQLIDASHQTPPHELGALIAEHAAGLGVSEAVMYLASLEQRTLEPLAGRGVPPRDALDIDGTLGGRAYRDINTLETTTDGRRRLWVPLLDGSARLGVLEATTDRHDAAVGTELRQFAGVASELIVSRSLYGDLFALTQRTRPMSLAAELQWSLLPPQTFNDNRVTISAVLEPAYAIAGDTFDYAFNGDRVHFAILDAMGHGFDATLLATVALAAYRHARRSGYDLVETYNAIDRTVARQFEEHTFLTAQLAQLDPATGHLRWVNAGHHAPMLLRDGNHVSMLEAEPALPIGFGGTVDEVGEEWLEPGDTVLSYTDGLVEARSPQGEFFGEDRLADLLVRADAAALPAAETSRRLVHSVLAHQQGRLQDDATVLLLCWHGTPDDPAGVTGS